MSLDSIISMFDTLMAEDVKSTSGYYATPDPTFDHMTVPDALLESLSVTLGAGRRLRATFQCAIHDDEVRTIPTNDPFAVLTLCLVPAAEFSGGSFIVHTEVINFINHNRYVAWYSGLANQIEPLKSGSRSMFVFNVYYVDDYDTIIPTHDEKITGLVKRYVDTVLARESTSDEIFVILSRQYHAITSLSSLEVLIMNEFVQRGYRVILEERPLLDGEAIDGYNTVELDADDLREVSKKFAKSIHKYLARQPDSHEIRQYVQTLLDDMNLDSYIEPDDHVYAVIDPDLLNALQTGYLKNPTDLRRVIREGNAFNIMAIQKSSESVYYTCQACLAGIEVRSQLVFMPDFS